MKCFRKSVFIALFLVLFLSQAHSNPVLFDLTQGTIPAGIPFGVSAVSSKPLLPLFVVGKRIFDAKTDGALDKQSALDMGFTFSDHNRFALGELVIVPRSKNSYSYGVISEEVVDPKNLEPQVICYHAQVGEGLVREFLGPGRIGKLETLIQLVKQTGSEI